MFRLSILLILLSLLYSCDPGYAVVLQNNSTKDRNIKVITTDGYKFTYRDSVSILDSIKRIEIPAFKNSNELSYTFTLESGKEAVLQQGIGGPDLTEKVVIENADTIHLDSDKRVHTKKYGMSTAVRVTIE
jgi:hypothetical protein